MTELLNRILNLPKQQKLGALAGLIVAILLLDYFLFYSPRSDETSRLAQEIETQRGHAEVTKIQAEADAYRRKRGADADLLVQLANAQGAELENRAYQGGGSENLVGMKMAEVLEGVDTVLVPSGGKGGMNPLDLNQALRLFDVAPEAVKPTSQ